MRHLLVGLLVLLPACTVTKAEHRALVEAGRRYRDAVGPIVADVTSRDLDAGRIHPQTALNRAGLDADFARALEDAAKRAGGGE